MNNLNDPPGWNIRPDQHGGNGDGNKWNYALMVPLLGLAAFRWIWTRESQRQVREIRELYDEEVKSVTAQLEVKYRETLSESRRTAAHLELELEKEQQRVQGYRQALVSHSQQLLQERRRLQEEREALQGEKRRMLASGAAGTLLQGALQRESEWEAEATAVLKQFEEELVERQSAYCSVLQPRERRLEMEKNILVRAAKEPVAARLNMENGLRDIFKNDRHCADLLNADKRKNGRLMWLYLSYWELQVQLHKHRKAEESLLGAHGSH